MRARSHHPVLAALVLGASVAVPAAVPAIAASPSPGASAAAAPAADVLTYRGGPGRDGNMPGPGPLGKASIAWVFQARGPFASQPMVHAGVVYAVSNEGTLHAINITTGAERWSVALGTDSTGSPLLLEDRVLVATNDGLRAISMADGSEVWRTTATAPLKGSPVLTGGHVVVAAEDGSVSAVDQATGTTLWTVDIGAGVDTSSAATDETVVVGTQTGQVVALAAADGTLRWRTDTGDGARVGTPAISDGYVYIATLDGGGPDSNHIRQLDLATGKVLWSFVSPDSVPSYSPAIVGGLAITEGESGTITALDTATGKPGWQAHVPGVVEIVPAVAGGVVYGASNDGVAFALDVATRKQLWQVPIDGVPYGAAVTGGLMLMGTNVGKLYAIGGDQP